VEEVKPVDFLTRTEELILLAVWRLQESAYGAAIRDYLSDVSGHEWSIGAIYIPLDRLARKGFVRTYMGESTAKRGGRRKRYFALTREGVAALNQIKTVQDKLWKGLPQVVFG